MCSHELQLQSKVVHRRIEDTHLGRPQGKKALSSISSDTPPMKGSQARVSTFSIASLPRLGIGTKTTRQNRAVTLTDQAVDMTTSMQSHCTRIFMSQLWVVVLISRIEVLMVWGTWQINKRAATSIRRRLPLYQLHMTIARLVGKSSLMLVQLLVKRTAKSMSKQLQERWNCLQVEFQIKFFSLTALRVSNSIGCLKMSRCNNS